MDESLVHLHGSSEATTVISRIKNSHDFRETNTDRVHQSRGSPRDSSPGRQQETSAAGQYRTLVQNLPPLQVSKSTNLSRDPSAVFPEYPLGLFVSPLY